ncbi:transglutaminase [Pueribacillus theae]|uniref:Transglutaminase n=1 Tax=Pueribacillus theae TaxID=2171751 RepID=A0A2U1JQ74_9BACI|nr:transglutaminaseTgpA domain-containing protein [Pueribacillus theae]PWA07043.1 transglutaminase [Pueribacillus theae]
MKQLKSKRPDFYSFILFLLGFFLFWEWLLPLQEVGQIASFRILLLFTVFVFLLSYLNAPVWLTIPFNLIAILFVIHHTYFSGSIFKLQWLESFLSQLNDLFRSLVSGNFDSIGDVSRTFLFLLLLCLIGYLMKQWLIKRRNAFLFLFMTIIYVTVIDTFTPYDARFAIIRIVVMGFILIGLLQVAKIQENEGFGPRLRFPVTWFGLVVVMILTASLVGIAAPKAEPQWEDPVPFIKSLANMEDENGLNGQTKKIGYGTNDEHLGGPFELDTTPVFYADSDTEHYWRAETRDVYTGKGWTSSREETKPFYGTSKTLYEENAKIEEKEANIQMTGLLSYPFLFYPGQLKKVKTPDIHATFEEDRQSGKISTKKNGRNYTLKEYTLTYDDPTFSIDELKKSDGLSYPEEIQQTYLQLPDTLPNRVEKLAREVTADSETSYEKAKDIESYFSRNGFEYDTKNVAIPGEKDDYVDQFLFETKKGYCDNFSSSMVVMLRSIGIPARWVKGFTEGDFKEILADGKKRHLITNKNAHSWVEAYFPGSGWVPFEPTRGFQNPFQFISTFESTAAQIENRQVQDEKEEEKNEVQHNENGQERETIFPRINLPALLAIVGAVLLIGLLFMKYYRSLARQWVLRKYSNRFGESKFFDAYKSLLWLFDMHGYKREPHQTLREFAFEIDEKLGNHFMMKLTKVYEEKLYSSKKEEYNWPEIEKLWKNLIKKLSY